MKLSELTLPELKQIYSATYGIFPSETVTQKGLIGMFERDLKFGRNLYTWVGEGVQTRTLLTINQ